jgi:hypothetical protein
VDSSKRQVRPLPHCPYLYVETRSAFQACKCPVARIEITHAMIFLLGFSFSAMVTDNI